MTNFYDVANGLSQDEPGPLEPVEIAQQDDTLARTGNTARDQEMYAAGIRTGEENTKHNAAIRTGAGWLPIESAPKDGQSILGRGPRQDTVVIAWDEWAQPEARWKAVHLDVNGYECPEIVLRGEPTLWQPMPAPLCPTCNDQGAVGNILTAQPCPDCAAPGVSTVEDPGFPAGAIVNGRTLADRLEAYPFQSEGGDLRLCADWVEFRRCFEYLAEWVGSRAPAAGDALDAARWRFVRRKLCLTGNGDGTCAMQAINLPASIPGWPEPGSAVAEFCDAAIDAAIAAQRKGDA